jgi:hypothetical protein
MINFVLLTYSRKQDLKVFFQMLHESKIYKKIPCRLIIADSGSRGKDFFEKMINEISGFKIRYKYLATSANDAIENMYIVSKKYHEPSFYFHDDDKVKWLEIIKFIDKYSKIRFSYGFCFKFGAKPKLIYSLFKGKAEEIKIALSYILSHDGNCPLISGVFLSSPKDFGAIYQGLIYGKYKDVDFLMYIARQSTSYIHHTNYINYQENFLSDNKVRHLLSRDSLSKFFKAKGEPEFLILSGLVYWGYKERVIPLLNAYTKLIFQPKIFLLVLIKTFYRLKAIVVI